MRKIKTWKDWLDEFPDVQIITNEDVREAMLKEIYELRDALAESKHENETLLEQQEYLMQELQISEIGNDIKADRLTRLAEQKPIVWKWDIVEGSEFSKRKGAKSGVYLEDPEKLPIEQFWKKLYPTAGAQSRSNP